MFLFVPVLPRELAGIEGDVRIARAKRVPELSIFPLVN